MKEVEKHEFQYRGSYWRPELWDLLSEGQIKHRHAILLLLIDALVQHRGDDCYASNGYLAKRIGTSEKEIQRCLSDLKKLGLVIQTAFDGRRRFLRTAWSRLVKNEQAEGVEDKSDRTKMSRHQGQKCPVENTKGEYSAFKGTRRSGGLVTNARRGESAPPPKEATSGKFQKVFLRMYEDRFGEPYLGFTAQHGANMRRVFHLLNGDLQIFKPLVRLFFEDDHPICEGHPIPILMTRLNRYREQLKKSHPESNPTIRVITRDMPEGFVDEDN